MKHSQSCAIVDDGPCTCGAEEAHDDELDQEMSEELEAKTQ